MSQTKVQLVDGFDINTSVPDDSLVIDSSGRVGIGTTSPAEALTVGTGNAQITSGQLTVGVTSTSGLQFINDGTLGTLNSIPLILRTASAERARIDTSGRLLVGTSSARSDFFNANTVAPVFQVQGTGNNRIVSVTAVDTSSSSGGGLVLAKSRSTGNTVVQSDDAFGTISFQGSDGSEIVEGASIAASVDGTPGANDMPGRLVFSTTADGASSPTERMRINNAGDTEIAKNGASAHVGIFIRTGSSDRFRVNANASDTNGGFFYYNTSNLYGTISDRRLKNNIQISSATDDVAFIKEITPHVFNFDGKVQQLGFIAQNVLSATQNDAQKVAVANWESYDETNPDCPFLGVSISPIVAALVNVCKVSLKRIEDLEAKVAALETQ